MDCRGRTQLDGDSAVGGIVVNFQDITERKRAEGESVRQRSFLDAVLRQMPVGVSLAFDAQGRFITTNQAGKEIFEAEPGENVSAGAPAGERPPTDTSWRGVS